MRLALVSLILLPLASARAEPPAPVIPDNALWATDTPQQVNDQFAIGKPRLDLLLGLPLALRYQTPLWHDGSSALQAEFLGGLYLIFPVAGAGLRYQWEAFSWKGRHLVVSPGLGLYGLYNTLHDGGGWFGGGPSGWGLAVADLDLVWSRSNGQFGVKFGLGGGGQVALPFVALFAGWQF